MSRPGAPSSNDTPTSFTRRGAKGEEGGGERKRLAPRGREVVVGGWRRRRRRRRGREGEAASADCQAASECQRRSLPESRTSRLETPNKQRLSHRVNVGGDKLQRRPPSCDAANQRAEACGGGRQSEATPSRPVRGGCSPSDRDERGKNTSASEEGRREEVVG